MQVTETLGFQMSLFLFAALLGYALAVRIGQSAVVGSILIGILIGPSALGLITYNDIVRTLAELGAIFLLFTVGLECNFREVYTRRNFLIALSGVIIPFILGYLVTVLFSYGTLQALFVGTALAATSIAITANVLKELGKLSTATAKVIIGAAVIDDILGLILLSITTGVVRSEVSLASIGLRVLAAALFVGATFLFTPLLSRLILRVDRWATRTGHFQVTIIAAMTIAFGYSTLAEAIGLSAIVGAFLAGLSLEPLGIKSYREGAYYYEMLFSAVFFVSLGVLVSLREVTLISWFLPALLIAAFAGKLAGCYLPARMSGMGGRDALIVSTGMIPRGEVAMIVALFGLTSGALGQELYGTILLMALVTTMAVPFLIRKLYRAEGRRHTLF
ncbi:MAG: cation:proton antiporter [Candidatus Aenigmarchaeota archaeon]|nr:cation:proton antiporter [Candidatus Aenigmarchaeota archaeon]